MDSIVGIIASGAALLTATAAFWTILEVKRQREATYKPRLIIPSRRILVRQTNGVVEQFDSTRAPFIDGYWLELQNLGFGSAIDIVVSWKIDYEEIIRRIKLIPSSSLFEIKDVGWIEIKSTTSKLPIRHVSTKTEMAVTFNHIQPLSTQASVQRIEVPSMLLDMLRIYLFLCCNALVQDLPRDQIEEIQELADLPVFLKVEYHDLAKRKFQIGGRLVTDVKFAYAGMEFGEQWLDYVTCNLGVRLD